MCKFVFRNTDKVQQTQLTPLSLDRFIWAMAGNDEIYKHMEDMEGNKKIGTNQIKRKFG